MSYFTAEKLGVALARARVAAGLSQVDMARRINKGKATIQSWECGASSPPADKIMDWFELAGLLRSPPCKKCCTQNFIKSPYSANQTKSWMRRLQNTFAQRREL